MQDVDNLGWKLGLVINGAAPDALLDTYDEERIFGADENILNSTRSTDFITPKSKTSHHFRNAVLKLAETHAFARPLVNSGRLSMPCVYATSSLNTPDALPTGPATAIPGSACKDAPFGEAFLLDQLGDGFTIMSINTDVADVAIDGITIKTLHIDDPSGALTERYLGDAASAVYLIRPDQHVAARWEIFDDEKTHAAILKACAKD